MRTIGLSPKLYPPIIGVAVGAILVFLLADDSIGTGVILTSFASLGLGVALPPGTVVPDVPKKKAAKRPAGEAGQVDLVGLLVLILVVVLVIVLIRALL